MPLPLTFEKVNDAFKKRNCKLLVTKSEFENNKMDSYTHVTYIATCWHENTITYNQFTVKKRGDYCIVCSRKKQSEDRLLLHRNDPLFTNKIEHQGLLLCEKHLDSDFIIKDTNEGCLADVILKPKSVNADLWLPIQLKTTLNFDKQYSRWKWKLINNYVSMLLVCNSIKEEKFWVFDGNEIPNVITLSIGIKSKYNKYEVLAKNLCSIVSKIYNEHNNKIAFNFAMFPITEQCQTEVKYKLMRETKLGIHLDFVYSKIKGTVWDFQINGKRVQEKVITKNDSGSYKCTLFKHGRRNNTTVNLPYEIGDNDYFMLYIPNTMKLYLIPEELMISSNCLRALDSKGKSTIYLHPNLKTSNFICQNFNQYLYDLDDPDDIEKIIQVFS